MEVYIDDEAKLTLHGLRQHYVKLKDSEKNRKLFELLDVLEFNQVCIVKVESLKSIIAETYPLHTPNIFNKFSFYLSITSLYSAQVVIFVKSVQRCVALAQLLIEQNFPAIAIHRGMTQEERLSR